MQSRLGKYTLLERLAVGGMAELFLAKANAQHGFEKTVALKRILPAFAENDDFVDMFMQEAHLAAGLHHPNIAQVFDFGEEKGTYFFTMEYVQGKNLREILHAASEKRIGFPLASVLHVICGVAAGLHHAHEHQDTDGRPLGVVHRDVSPSNIIVTYDGHIKIVDFGIAKAAAFGTGTHAGALKGKVPYMSPEQCRGEAVDRRSDIFSIGTLLWELSTAQRLFRTEGNEVALLHRVANAVIPAPTSILAKYPPKLESLVLKALARERGDRFSTAHDLLVALEEFAHGARLTLSPTRMARYMDDLFPRSERPHIPLTGAFASLTRNTTRPGRTTQVTGAGFSQSHPPTLPTAAAVTATNPPGFNEPGPRPGTPSYAWAIGILVVLLGVAGAAWAVTSSTPATSPPPTAVAPASLATPRPTAPPPSVPKPSVDATAIQPPKTNASKRPQVQAPAQEQEPEQEPRGNPTEQTGTPTLPPIADAAPSRRPRAKKRATKRPRERAEDPVVTSPSEPSTVSSSTPPPSDSTRPSNGVFLPSRATKTKPSHSPDDFL